jgi:hypothetical protein
MVKKRLSEGFDVAILGSFAFLLVALISYGFLIANGETITGKVVREEEFVVCTADYRPVCGMDGNNYSNFCMMESVGIELLHKGECGGPVDSIYFGGSIITMDGDSPEYAEAVSVKNGNVVFVGELIEAAGRQGTYTFMKDLGRHTMLPDHIGDLDRDVTAMTRVMREWTSYDDVQEDMRGSIAVGKPADFIIINLDLIIRDRMNISDVEILEIVRGDEVIYEKVV